MMPMLDLFWVFFWLMLLGIVLVFVVALVQDIGGGDAAQREKEHDAV